MICTSIQNKTAEEILSILDDPFVEMAEIRLDRCELSDDDIDLVFGTSDVPLIATCRAADLGGNQKEAERRLLLAIESGARYADLEIEAPVQVSKKFRIACEKNDTQIIRSFHDFEGTPDLEYLKQVVGRCFRYGADIAKVVVTCRTPEDAKTVEALYTVPFEDGEPIDPSTLTAFGMGAEGRDTRISCLKNGAPFSYAALTEEEAAAPGQWAVEKMYEAVYGELPLFFRDELQMPASKSFAQRAIIAAALAEGTSHLKGYSPCSDSEAAIAVARALGAKVTKRLSTLTIQGIGPVSSGMEIDKLHTVESGLLTRLMIPILAQLGKGDVVVTGEKTLLGRPLKGAADIMASFGVVLSNVEPQPGSKEVHIPARVKGNLIPGTADISGAGGSQLISGLLMALALADAPSTLYVSEPKSIPYMFITLDVLRKFGVNVGCEMEGDKAALEAQDWSGCTSIKFTVKGGQHYKAADFDIEGDWSAAANFLVAGAVFGSAELEGLDSKSLQADISIIDVLVQAGASVSLIEDEGVVYARKAPLEAFEYDLNNAPDIFPIVAVLAAFCPGESRIAGAGRLVGKESNRAEAIVNMLTQMGVEAGIEGDELYVLGQSLDSRALSGNLLKGGMYTTHHDHRMAMALKVASLGADSPIEMDDRLCVGKSFPEFFEMFD